LGIDPSAAKDIETMHAKHISSSASDFVVDRAHKIVSTPAWMLKTRISEIEKGIEKLIGEVLAMI
jgi:enhancing lycopene biosynthesis protein 2